MSKKKTTEEFKKEVYDLVKDEYEVLGEYINAKTQIKIKHNKCGCIYDVKPTNFTSRGNRCPNCYGVVKKTTEEFKKEVYSLVGDEYTVVGEYINNRTHIEMLHTLCGNKYTVVPSSFLAGTRCPECYGKKQKTTKEFKQEVYDLVGDEYTVLEEYKNSHTNISIKHNKCGHIYNVRPANFIHGKRCPKCMRPNHDKDTTKFKNEIVELVGDEYSLLSEYNKAREHVTIKHNICGYIYLVTPDAFLRGSRCPKCTRPNYDRDTEKFKEEVYNLVGDEYEVLG